MLGTEVTGLDAANQTVLLDDGEVLSYDEIGHEGATTAKSFARTRAKINDDGSRHFPCSVFVCISSYIAT